MARERIQRFRWAFVFGLFLFCAELGVAWLAGSLALLADAGHLFLDVVALGLAYFGARWALRRPDSRYTYGFRRAEVLAAAVNGFLLLFLVGFVVREALERLGAPREIWGGPTLAMGVVGFLGNAFMALLLHRHEKSDLNMRAAFLHVLGDALGSLAVILAGIAIVLFGKVWVDAAASFFIAGIVLFGALRILRDAGRVLFEAVPEDLSFGEIAQTLRSLPGVQDVHDLHVWSLVPGFPMLTAHLVLGNCSLAEADAILAQARKILGERFGIEHVTLQAECAACEGLACNGRN